MQTSTESNVDSSDNMNRKPFACITPSSFLIEHKAYPYNQHRN